MANFYGPESTVYSSRQRAVGLTLGVACSIPLTSTMAFANGAGAFMPVQPTMHTVFQSPGHQSTFQSAGHQPTFQSAGHQTAFQSPVHHSAMSFVHGIPSASHTLVSGGALNLASSSLSYLAGNLANFSSLTIDVGNRQEQVNLNTKLTAAEVVAVEQVIAGGGSTGAQTIKLGSNGAASGGTVALNNNLLTALDNSVGGSISSLTIAKGVQVVDSLSVLSLSGNLSNYGTISTAAGSSGSSDTITAGSILNASSGAIGSYGGGGGLVGADPNLNAATSLTNNGSITSAGNLNISAPVVYNVASHGSAAAINAAQTVNISTASLNNSGQVTAGAGNINVASTAGLSLTGSGGTLQANNGNVNLTSTNADINVSGGNMLSQQVNFNAGAGNVNADLGQVTGTVNAIGDSVHIVGNSQNLVVGAIDATGDPLIANSGNVVLATGNPGPTGGGTAPLTIVAGQNIVSDSASTLDTSSNSGNGSNLTLIAGVAFTGTSATGVTVTKGSTTGGIIDLTGGNNTVGTPGPVNSITSNSIFGGGNAGNILMVAYAGKNLGSGSVITPAGITIDASAKTGSAGTVTIIAGAKTGASIATGGIVGTTVTVDSSTPVITLAKGGKGVGYDKTGALVASTGTFGPSKTFNPASISLGNVNATTLNISTGSSASVTNSSTGLNLGTVVLGKTGGLGVSDSSAGNINFGGVITGGSTTIVETGTGKVSVSGSGSINTTSLSLTTADATGTDINTVNTNVSSILFSSAGSSIVDTQGVNTMSLSGKISAGTGTVAVTSNGQINVTSLLGVNNTSVSLTTLATDKGGISLAAAAPINVGTGSINLTLQGKGLLTQAVGNTLTASTLTIISDTGFGSKTVGISTSAATLDVQDTGSKNVVYLADTSNGTLTLEDLSGTAGGSLFLTSQAGLMNVASANYNNVSLTDNVAGVTGVDFSSKAGPLGTGLGTFTVVSATAITDTAGATLHGTTVTLTGATGVGAAAAPVFTTSPILALNSANGSVFASDSVAATVNGASSLNVTKISGTFLVTDTGAGAAKTLDSLTVGKSVGGGNIVLTTAGLTPGVIAVTGTLGTTNTTTVGLVSGAGVSTKGAINGGAITISAAGGVTAGGPALIVGGTITGGGLGSSVGLSTTGATTNSITVGGVVSANAITIKSIGTVTTTKAISGINSGSTVQITGTSGSATTNALTIGGAITGIGISLKNTVTGGGIALNANVGGPTTSVTLVDTTTGGGAISGKGVIGGQAVTLDANLAIGTAKAPILTAAVNLNLNTVAANTGGSFITQKGNLAIDTVQTDNLVLKVTGTTDVAGPVTVGQGVLTSTGATTIGGNITGTGASPNALLITSGGAFTTNAGSNISATSEPVTINVTGVGTINGTINAGLALNLTTSGALTIATGGVVGSATTSIDTLTSKGAINVNGTLGNALGLDTLKVTATGAFIINNATAPGKVDGAAGSTIGALTIANFGTSLGGITYNATGTGNSFSNFGTLGKAADNIVINATKGAIVGSTGGVINAGTVALNALSTNLAFSGTTAITAASVKGALDLNVTGGVVTVGSPTATGFTAGSVNAQYTAINNNTFTVGSIATTTGDLVVASSAKNLAVSAGATLTTLLGNITLQNNNVNAGANIVVNANATFHASAAKTNLNQGNVNIVMGAVPTAPVPGTNPGATVNPTAPGQVFFGTNSITVAGVSDILNATGRNIVFNTGAFAAAAITLGANVTITADPPAGGVAGMIGSPINANALAIPMASVAVAPISAASSTVSANSSTMSFAAINAPSVNASTINTLTVANPALSAGFLSSAGNIATAQNEIGSISSGASYLSATPNLNHGDSMVIDGQPKLSGGVSNTAHRRLDRGPLLLIPEHNTVVDTPFGSVSVAANSIALIISTENGLAVYNLHDAHGNAVVINHSSGSVALTPGRSAVLTRSPGRSFEDVNPAPFVTYRQVASRDLGNVGKLYQSEFDMISMIHGLPQMSHLMTSDSARTRKTMASMLKTAAILMQLSPSREAYSYYVPAKVTAYLSSATR